MKNIALMICALLLFTGCQNDPQAMNPMSVGEGQISSDFTTASSEQFPHTKPIQTQHAKYDFEVAHSVQLTREEAIALLPNELSQHIPEGVRELTPEQLTQILPEGVTSLPREEIIERLKNRMPIEQADGQGPAPEPGIVQPDSPSPEVEEPRTETEGENQVENISDLERLVAELTNQERRNNGLPDLQLDDSLSHVARVKSQDMEEHNYFLHTSPTYGSPFDMIRDFDISYQSAAENIAQGQRSAEEVVQAWMTSEGHRANILNQTYTHIGVGYHEEGHYWTQMFISR
ncbi:hypothetical exported protein [Halalkalibacter wakoensis JCM 9140]|uniref:Hypothetical exported protein n=1 Tax=Halalkalibacter wakoensis JCM 9140 TaxID=1236970 RepID=W4PZE5_9BACI|nr:CAP domain-containing protein [Halalkalibacter wakoensis]GAE25112.1 hypothetical exported protein [Halalkalibacter wakoensis JCM 9140]